MSPENATPLLWAHQLKREHKHLLQRVETLESTLQPTTPTAITTIATAVASYPDGNNVSEQSWLKATIEEIESRVTCLERSGEVKAAEAVETHRVQNHAFHEQVLAAVQSKVEDLLAGVKDDLSRVQRERDELSNALHLIRDKVRSLDIEIAADAVAVKQAGDGVTGLHDSLSSLTDRVWAVENGVTNLESGRREDQKRFGAMGVRLAALAKDVEDEKERIERVYNVAGILVDRDEEVRGRVGLLENRLASRVLVNEAGRIAQQPEMHDGTVPRLHLSSNQGQGKAGSPDAACQDRPSSSKASIPRQQDHPEDHAGQHGQADIGHHQRQQQKEQHRTMSPTLPSGLIKTPQQPATSNIKRSHKRQRRRSPQHAGDPPPANKTPPSESYDHASGKDVHSSRSKNRNKAKTLNPVYLPSRQTRSQTRAAAVAESKRSGGP